MERPLKLNNGPSELLASYCMLIVINLFCRKSKIKVYYWNIACASKYFERRARTGKVKNLHAHVNPNLQHVNPDLHVL